MLCSYFRGREQAVNIKVPVLTNHWHRDTVVSISPKGALRRAWGSASLQHSLAFSLRERLVEPSASLSLLSPSCFSGKPSRFRASGWIHNKDPVML